MLLVSPELSVILVVGERRERSQGALNALCAQTAIDRMEIVVLDIAGDAPRLTCPATVSLTYLVEPHHETLGGSRYAAFRHATAPIAAFVEDHAIARRDWAESLIRAHAGGWAAVGYAFENSNPQTYLSRSCMVNDYGRWMTPARGGVVTQLAGHNVSYKRDALLAFGAELESLLTPDFLIHQALIAKGERLYLEAGAIVGHENFTHVSDAIGAHFTYMRMLAGMRVRVGRWSMMRRLIYGLGVLPGAPVLGWWRLYGRLAGRAPLIPVFLAALPIVVPLTICSAVGESLGYLFGEGSSGKDMSYWESTAVRS